MPLAGVHGIPFHSRQAILFAQWNGLRGEWAGHEEDYAHCGSPPKFACQSWLMNTLVICRIADARLRKSIFGRLENRGVAQAKGFYECDFDSRELAALQKWLKGLKYGPGDLIMVYSLCSACQKDRQVFGPSSVESVPDAAWVII